MKYLFVGGPKHGEQIEVPDNLRTLRVPEPIRNDYAAYVDHGSEMCLKACCCGPTFAICDYDRLDVGTDRIIYVARRTHR